MPDIIGFVQWRTQNIATKYPFAERATLTSTKGKVLLEGIFVDAVLHPPGGSAGMHLSRIVITSESATFFIGTNENKRLCSGVMSCLNIPDRVDLRDPYQRPAGLLLSEGANMGAIRALGLGEHDFTPDATEFAATVCQPLPAMGVTGFLLEDGSVISGRVRFCGENGAVVSRTQRLVTPRCGQPYYEQGMRVDIVGNPLFRRRLCENESAYFQPRPISKVEVRLGEQVAIFPMTKHEDFQIKPSPHASSDSVLRIVNSEKGIDINVAGGTP